MSWRPIKIDASITHISTGAGFIHVQEGAYLLQLTKVDPNPEDRDVVIGETEYGVTFASVLARDNVVATQFHPEKSGEMGLRMYANFLAQVGAGVA